MFFGIGSGVIVGIAANEAGAAIHGTGVGVPAELDAPEAPT
jgi:hypothetical protein